MHEIIYTINASIDLLAAFVGVIALSFSYDYYSYNKSSIWDFWKHPEQIIFIAILMTTACSLQMSVVLFEYVSKHDGHATGGMEGKFNYVHFWRATSVLLLHSGYLRLYYKDKKGRKYGERSRED